MEDPIDKFAAPIEGLEVPIDSIEKELSKFWTQTLPDQADLKDASIIKACALNFVVVFSSSNSDDIKEMRSTIKEVAKVHPARVILINALPDFKDEKIKANIWAYCKTLPAGVKICHEDIYLEAKGSGVEDIDNILFSILVPDVPTFFWWDKFLPPSSKEKNLFANIVKYSKKLIIDSAKFKDPVLQLPFFLNFAQSFEQPALFSCNIPVGDLTWQRISQWKNLMAQPFDSKESWNFLYQINHVTIESSQSLIGSPLLLLLGWLASRLNWRPYGMGFRPEKNNKDSGAYIELSFNISSNSLCVLEGIHRITLKGENGFQEIQLINEKYAKIILEIKGCPIFSNIALVSKPDIKKAIIQELTIMGHDNTYSEALKIAVDFINNIKL